MCQLGTSLFLASKAMIFVVLILANGISIGAARPPNPVKPTFGASMVPFPEYKSPAQPAIGASMVSFPEYKSPVRPSSPNSCTYLPVRGRKPCN